MTEDDKLLNTDTDMSNPSYSIGIVSKMLEMHPQTIRYFDTQGIITPSRDNKSGERKYSIYDIYKLTLRKQYQNLGFSIKETEDLLNKFQMERIIHKFLSEEEELNRQKKRTGTSPERFKKSDFNNTIY